MSANERKQTLSRNLARLMEERECTRHTLSVLLNVPYTTLTEWCRGLRYPRISNLEKIAAYFGVTITELIEEHNMDALPSPEPSVCPELEDNRQLRAECMAAIAILERGDWLSYLDDDTPDCVLNELYAATDVVKRAFRF